MCQLLESIKCKDGKLYNITAHEQRMRESVSRVFGIEKKFSLKKILRAEKLPKKGLHKCRIIYDKNILSVDIAAYRRKKVTDVTFVFDDKIEYGLKYLDRSHIEKYCKSFPKSTEVIFVKKDMLRDASYSNLALFNGFEWHTPTYPLLKGTMRAKLLEEGKVKSKKIYYNDLNQYSHISFINALNDLEDRVLQL